MRPSFLPSGMTAAQQYLRLRSASPLGGRGQLSPGQLVWFYSAQPSLIGRLYDLELRYQQGGQPQVIVSNPHLPSLAGGKDLPHVFQQDPTRLCLFLPGTREWTAQRALADTVLPWSLLWLYYFEVWLSSGEWTGGGMHPSEQRPRNRGKSSR